MSKTVAELLVGVLERVGVIKGTGNIDRTSTTISARMGVGSWIILIVLLSLLVATGVVIYLGWTLANGTDVPTSGYAAMAFGVIISLAVGFGLMALLFYSGRKAYEEPPVMAATLNGSSRLSGNTIPITSSAPPFRYQSVSTRELLRRGGQRHTDLVLKPRVAACAEKHTAPAVPARSMARFPSGNVASQFITSPRLGRFGP